MGGHPVPYAATLAAAAQWLETWRRTGRTRHLQTALACARIARDMSRVSTDEQTPGQHAALLSALLDDQSDSDAVFAEITKIIGQFGDLVPPLIAHPDVAPPKILFSEKDLRSELPGQSTQAGSDDDDDDDGPVTAT